jgi:hypothetical protein
MLGLLNYVTTNGLPTYLPMGYLPILTYQWSIYLYLIPTYIYKIGTMKSLHEGLFKGLLKSYLRVTKGPT